MRIFIWILIIGLIWMLAMPTQLTHEGFGRINIRRAVSHTANQVGGAISKIATVGLSANAKKVLKNLGTIKRSISSFTKKGGDGYAAIPLPLAIPLNGKKCGAVS